MNNEMDFLIYRTPSDDVRISVTVRGETVWLTQRAMAELFGVQVPAISKHIKNIYEDGELSEDTTISKMETVVNRGFRGEISEREYLQKGFAMDDDFLKNMGGGAYWKELLERIRASEKVMYRQVLDL